MRLVLSMTVIVAFAGCAGNVSDPSAPAGGVASDALTGLESDAAAPGTTSACPPLAGTSLGLTPDGDFHDAPNPGRHSWVTYGDGQYIPNTQWQVTQTTVELYGHYSKFPSKICSIDLDGTPGNGTITHDAIATTPGTTYTVGFLYSGNGSCGPDTKQMQVTAGGQTSPTFTWTIGNKHDAHHGQYTTGSWQFGATSSSTSLAFLSLDPPGGNCGPVVTGISVAVASIKKH